MLTLAQAVKEKRKIMPPFLYRCPNIGDNVPAWADDEPDDDDFTYVHVRCLACAQMPNRRAWPTRSHNAGAIWLEL